MKKRKDKIASPSNGYIINIKGDLKRLEKGMSKNEVITILGDPLSIEKGASSINEKMIFKISNSNFINTRYSILFTNDLLIYVAKLN